MNTSYEALADAAYAAAIDAQKKFEGKETQLQAFETFVSLLREPLDPNGSYKLLYDPRTAPFYKAAWSDTFGPSSKGVKTEVVLKQISDYLEGAKLDFSGLKKAEIEQIASFCLALNRMFLEQNGRSMSFAYFARTQDASS